MTTLHLTLTFDWLTLAGMVGTMAGGMWLMDRCEVKPARRPPAGAQKD